MPYIIRPMELSDIPEVMDIEKQCFSMPWPAHAYRRELRDNRLSRYIVAEWVEDDKQGSRAGLTPVSVRVPQHAEARGGGQGPSAQSQSLVKRALSHLIPVLVRQESEQRPARLVGYAGLWLMLDEAHVTTIAVRPTVRGIGLGELLFIGLIDMASALGARFVTLEVRVSNTVAQTLYRKFGFKEEGTRRRYYSDNGEDALIMWSEPITSATFQARLAQLKAELDQKLEHANPPQY